MVLKLSRYIYRILSQLVCYHYLAFSIKERNIISFCKKVNKSESLHMKVYTYKDNMSPINNN